MRDKSKVENPKDHFFIVHETDQKAYRQVVIDRMKEEFSDLLDKEDLNLLEAGSQGLQEIAKKYRDLYQLKKKKIKTSL